MRGRNADKYGGVKIDIFEGRAENRTEVERTTVKVCEDKKKYVGKSVNGK